MRCNEVYKLVLMYSFGYASVTRLSTFVTFPLRIQIWSSKKP